MEYARCICVWLGAAWVKGEGRVNERFGFGLYQSCGDRGSVGRVCDLVAVVLVV